MAKKPKGFRGFDALARKLTKVPASEFPIKRFCRRCSHDIWQHGDSGCRKSGCKCRLKADEA